MGSSNVALELGKHGFEVREIARESVVTKGVLVPAKLVGNLECISQLEVKSRPVHCNVECNDRTVLIVSTAKADG